MQVIPPELKETSGLYLGAGLRFIDWATFFWAIKSVKYDTPLGDKPLLTLHFRETGLIFRTRSLREMSKVYFQVPYSPITSYFVHSCSYPTNPEHTFCCDKTWRIVAPDSNQVAENLSLHDQVRQNLLDDTAIWLGYAKSTISEIN